MIKNKKKQEKFIKRLKLIKSMYDKLSVITYKEEREKFIKGEISEIRHSSEDIETFKNRHSPQVEELLKLYNTLNEKLPHHMRLDLLE